MHPTARNPDHPPADGMVPSGDPRATLWNLIRGPWRFAAIHALAVLGCPSYLSNGPLPLVELAARCGANPDTLERLLRCAASAGLLAQTVPGCYALTTAGQVLIPGTPGSLHPAIMATGNAAAWQAMTGLAATARGGPPPFAAQQGCGFYDYLAANPGQARVFSEFMTSRSADIAAVIACLDFSGAEVVADIGGGYGTILGAILTAWPQPAGVLFDRAQVVGDVYDYLADAGLTSRARLATGDYLTGPVPAADTYLVASILHNHDDHEARVILGHIVAAATRGPRVLLADILLPDHPAPHIGCDLDVRMMTLGTGRERTRAGYLTLLHSAGLVASEVIGTPYGLSIIDAHPATDDAHP